MVEKRLNDNFTITYTYYFPIYSLITGNNFINYLSNNIFPPLLSEEEEAKNLELFAAGDIEARNILIEHNLRLVAHICKKFESTGLDKGDLLSIGTIGLIKGINTFCLDKGTRLATYVARCIENEILMHLRAIRNQKYEISLYDPVGVDKEGNEVSLLDLLSRCEGEISEAIEEKEEKEDLYQKLIVLDDKEKFVIRLRFGLGGVKRLTQREIAKKLGISRSYVSRIEKKAVGKLLKEMERQKENQRQNQKQKQKPPKQ